MKTHRVLFLCSMLVCLLAIGTGSALGTQPNDQAFLTQAPPKDAKSPDQASKKLFGSLTDVFAQIDSQEPIRRAGVRANLLRQVQTTVPVVVIVSDTPSYLFAISNWENLVRFPVLWDNGTVQSHEDIARFVRAFDPEQVVRLNGSLDMSWPGDREHKQQVFESVLSKALNESSASWRDTIAEMREQGIVSPGVVVTDVMDKSWPAALALSAGRFQPIIFADKPKSKAWDPVSSDDADALERLIERGVSRTGLEWDEIGDAIDTVTLAMNTGTTTIAKDGKATKLALSDRIGRRGESGSGEKWAWCGQIIGNESRVVYQAMCALFLTIDQGFIFDGYNNSPPWSAYDGSAAGDILKKAKFELEIHDEPQNGLEHWMLRMVRPIGDADAKPGSAGLFLMNSRGGAMAFHLPGSLNEGGKPGSFPIFNVPMAMHLVHSYSLQAPVNVDTVGGRLIERGVFVYAGSVDEPFLNAFVPTPAIANRLVGSLAFAAAVHYDNRDVWKIAVLGDPLVTIGPAGRRVTGAIEIPGAINLEERSKERLKAGEFEGAIKDLSLLGRDESIARIALALMKDKPESFGPGVAQASIPAMFRQGEYSRLVDAYERLDASGQVDRLMQDLLWLSSPYLLARASGDPAERNRLEALLRANIRGGQSISDAETLAMYMRKRSIKRAVGILEALRPTLKKWQLKSLDQAIARVRK